MAYYVSKLFVKYTIGIRMASVLGIILGVESFDNDDGRPIFTTHPQSTSELDGQSTEFTAAIDGPEVIGWQIFSSTWETQVETGGTFSITNVSVDQNGYLIRAFATNAFGTKFSAAATLTVAEWPNFYSSFDDDYLLAVFEDGV